MSTNQSNDKATQLRKLRDQKANLEKMISTLEDNENPATVDHLVPLLGFKDFKKPGPKQSFNVQVLCGLSDRMWGIFRQELRDIAVRQGVDTRLSLKNQLTQQSVTDAVTQMIKSRPELKKLADPDWFIRQTLRGMLKTSSESYRNLANDKSSRPKKAKNEDTNLETTGEKETESQIAPITTASTGSSSGQRPRRPKEKVPSCEARAARPTHVAPPPAYVSLISPIAVD